MAAGGAPPAPPAPADAGAHGDAGTRAAACSGRWAGAFADAAPDGQPIPIDVLPPGSVRGWLDGLPPAVAAWLTATRPALSRPAGPSPGTIVVVPSLGDEGAPRAVARALLVVVPGGEAGVWAYAGLPAALPGGVFELVPADGGAPVGDGPALGWALGAYAWDGYKKKGGTAADAAKPTLVWPAGADRVMVGAAAAATYLARDLVNEPASALGPAELEAAVRGVAAGIEGATVDTVVGDDLLAAGWPMVHAVGRAAAVGREPRLIELRWTGPDGDDRPEVVLVGKGVVFDTGGVNVKTTAGMRTMKKGTWNWGRLGEGRWLSDIVVLLFCSSICAGKGVAVQVRSEWAAVCAHVHVSLVCCIANHCVLFPVSFAWHSSLARHVAWRPVSHVVPIV